MNGDTIYYLTGFLLVLLSAADLIRTFTLLIRRDHYDVMMFVKAAAEILGSGVILVYFGWLLYFAEGQPNFNFAPAFRTAVAFVFVSKLIYVKDRIDINKTAARKRAAT